jgi:hypothetical protein
MGSNLTSILSAVAAVTINLDGDNVDVWLTSEVMDTAEIPQLPVRIISPLGMQGVRMKQQTLGAGAVLSAEWRVTDTLLLRAVGMGLGMRDVADLYTEYMSEYLDGMRALITNTWKLETLEQKPMVLEYPAGSGRKYHAVMCTLLFSEIVQ